MWQLKAAKRIVAIAWTVKPDKEYWFELDDSYTPSIGATFNMKSVVGGPRGVVRVMRFGVGELGPEGKKFQAANREIEQVIQFSSRIDLNYDCLRAIAHYSIA